VPERGREVGLADSDGAEDQCPAGIVAEPQRAQLRPELAVEPGWGVGAEGFQSHAGVEFRGAGTQLGGGPVAAVDLIGEQQVQEVGVR
jgi:hypothetical protein